MTGFLEAIELRAESALFPLLFSIPAVLAALGAVMVADLPPSVRYGMFVMILVMSVLERRRHSAGMAVERAVLGADGAWRVYGVTGAAMRARLTRSWGASGGPVIALEWACEGGAHRRAWFMRRQVDSRSWRRLRVRLRFA